VPHHPPTYSVFSFPGCLERCGTLTLNVLSARAPSQAKDLTDWCAWDDRILCQLPDYLCCRFPFILTHKKACHIEVAALLRARTIGNSPSALRNNIAELHSQAYLHKVQTFLALAQKEKRLWPSREFSAPPDFEGVPTLYWFLAIYVRDIMTRCKELKRSLASTYGRILKIDSTKKVIKKLAGHARHNATWVTNVGNERGEVLTSVVTSSESADGLQRMADDIMNRFAAANQPAPEVLYTDRDCCRLNIGGSKLNDLFHQWNDLPVRLDIWHFMRRLALGCQSESHPLYPTFMSQLTRCIFEWDEGDYEQLKKAVTATLQAAGL